jgi:hypothetical protein
MRPPSSVRVSAFFIFYVQPFTKHVHLQAGLECIGIYVADVAAYNPVFDMKVLISQDC